MNIAHYISNWWKEALEYKERVLKDGGTTKREDNVQRYYQMCKQSGIFDSIKFAWLGEAGGKFRDSGANMFWTKGYTLKPDRSTERRNLLTYTEELDNTAWVKNKTNLTANVIVSPTLINSAEKLFNDNTIANTHNIRQSITVTSGQSYTFSIYAKKAEYSFIRLWEDVQTGRQAYFNLNNGTATNVDFNSVGIIDVGNGWFRCYVTITSFTGTSFGCRILLTPDGTTVSYNGDGASGVYICGAQLELGSSPSSYQRVIDANSWDGVMTDATQTTSTSQPYITGNIAPTKRIGMKNPNGGSNYMTHPTISFAANEAWSVTTVVNFSNPNGYYCGVINGSGLLLSNGYLAFTNNSSVSQNVTIQRNDITGKNTVLTTTANGDGQINSYINGIFVQQRALSSSLNFDSILRGRSNSFFGGIHAHIIRSQALTPAKVATEANFLCSLYPEIPSVTIGSQTWATSNCEMVSTPQGNLIQNVTANTNIEKITNVADREFSSDTGFWLKDVGVTISGGYCNWIAAGLSKSLYKTSFLTADRWYKITFDVVSYTNGGLTNSGNGDVSFNISGTGNITQYFFSQSSTMNIRTISATNTLSIDNISIQEVGWSDATNLYNYVYTNAAGTDEQKTYAAVKAAAMWCYYNNDPALGSVYGKLYNWYAAKLLQMDIDYYNAANPSTPWGWRVPTDTDFNTLTTTLGGASVAGGKMKKDGLVYWASPNTGADNNSGFSAIPSGVRTETGAVTAILTNSTFISLDNKRYILNYDNTTISSITPDVRRGHSLRLIKN